MQNERSARLQCELYLAYCGRTLAVRRAVPRRDGHAVRITSGGYPMGVLAWTGGGGKAWGRCGGVCGFREKQPVIEKQPRTGVFLDVGGKNAGKRKILFG